MTYSDLAIGSLRKDRRSDTPPPIDVKAVASGAGSRATLLATSDRPARRTSALEQIAEDFARTRLQQLVEPSDVNALAGVGLRFDPKRQAVDTLVGDDTTAFDEAMAQGERLIAAGDYFRAEDAYDLAIRLKGGDTAAHIGRVHAQLAAGLYLAAAHNLRRLFNAHPELIVQRYTQPVLPDADRIRVIEADLTRLLEDPKRMDVPLLLAYLSYQQDRTTIVNNALTTLSRRGGPDPLVDMLRRAWTGQAPEPAATKTPE